MFGKKSKTSIETLIGVGTSINGDIQAKSGLRIDGKIVGNVCVDMDEGGLLVISQSAYVEGIVWGARVVIDGEVIGPVHSSELLELQPNARITGDVVYKKLEMHGGAVVHGTLAPHHMPESLLALPAQLPDEIQAPIMIGTNS